MTEIIWLFAKEFDRQK